MIRTLEAIFRRPLRLLMLLVLPLVISVTLAYFVVPHTYQSTAVLWALSRYQIIGAISGANDLIPTASQTQTSVLYQLLQTRTFVLTVAQETDVASTLELDPSVRSDPQMLDDALFAELSHNVVTTDIGDNLFSISYTSTDPEVAQQVVGAVVKNFGLQSIAISVALDQRLLENSQSQLLIAQQDANAAVAAESDYLLAHSKLTQNPNGTSSQLLTDPHYALLDQQRVQAQSVLQNLENNIATLKQAIGTQGLSADSFFKVIDAPTLASRPVSRLKQLLVAGGIGLGVAMLGCALYIIILVRRDRGVYTVGDLQKVTTSTMLMQLPRLASATMPLLVEESVYYGAMSGRGRGGTNGQLY